MDSYVPSGTANKTILDRAGGSAFAYFRPHSPNVLSLNFQHTKLARIRVAQPPGPTTAQMLVTYHTEHSTAIPNVFDWGLAQLLKQSPMV